MCEIFSCCFSHLSHNESARKNAENDVYECRPTTDSFISKTNFCARRTKKNCELSVMVNECDWTIAIWLLNDACLRHCPGFSNSHVSVKEDLAVAPVIRVNENCSESSNDLFRYLLTSSFPNANHSSLLHNLLKPFPSTFLVSFRLPMQSYLP